VPEAISYQGVLADIRESIQQIEGLGAAGLCAILVLNGIARCKKLDQYLRSLSLKNGYFK
jgi:hypothetical protein